MHHLICNDDSQQFISDDEMDYEPIEIFPKITCPILKALHRRFEIYLTNDNKCGEVYRIINNDDC